jgi:hypothetical protein
MTEESEDDQKPVFLTCNVTQESSSDVWFLDNGCSNHMNGNKMLFSSLSTNIQSEVKLGNHCKVRVNGKYVILVYDKNDERRKIDDVYYVPGMKCNLLSVGKLIEKNYRVFFKNKVCTTYDKYPSKQLISIVEMTKNIMFPLIMRNDFTDSLNAYKAKGFDE